MDSSLPIGAVEREVGLTKDVLRVWERRYGFPAPERDGNGERLYPTEQVRRLRLVKRLMDHGMRPGRLLGEPVERLEALCAELGQATDEGDIRQPAFDAAPLLAAIRAHDAAGLARTLQQRLAQQGLATFVQDTIAPLTVCVGDEWVRGNLEVFEEHLYTEVATRLLRQAIVAVPGGGEPVVLLTTAPEEPHGLGLLMVESLLALEGARCINLGTQVPPLDIARAAHAYEAQVVALSFSAAYPARRVTGVLEQLRASLPQGVQLWAGGAGVRRLATPEGVQLLAALGDAVVAVRRWPRGAAA